MRRVDRDQAGVGCCFTKLFLFLVFFVLFVVQAVFD